MKLEIGFNDNFEVRHETYTANIADSFTVLYLSDLHFNRNSAAINKKIIQRIEELDPAIILFGGDYVDVEKDLVYFDALLKALSHRDNVFAIAGNHDHNFNVAAVKKVVDANKVAWIENISTTIMVGSTAVRIDGTKPAKENNPADFSILCLHQPLNFNSFKHKYNLAFAGHLHGGQFVFWQHNKGLYPGKLFFRKNLLEKKSTHCHYYISKGLGHTIPIRFNCVKDIIFVQVTGQCK